MGDRRGSNQYQRKEEVQNIAQAEGKKSIEIAAEKAGFGNKETYRQAKKVAEKGEQQPQHRRLSADAPATSDKEEAAQKLKKTVYR